MSWVRAHRLSYTLGCKGWHKYAHTYIHTYIRTSEGEGFPPLPAEAGGAGGLGSLPPLPSKPSPLLLSGRSSLLPLLRPAAAAAAGAGWLMLPAASCVCVWEGEMGVRVCAWWLGDGGARSMARIIRLWVDRIETSRSTDPGKTDNDSAGLCGLGFSEQEDRKTHTHTRGSWRQG
jgi:hypothetical protein